jgi:hypothetical protein
LFGLKKRAFVVWRRGLENRRREAELMRRTRDRVFMEWKANALSIKVLTP